MKLALSLVSTLNAKFPSWWWMLLYAPGLISGIAGAMAITIAVKGAEIIPLCVFSVLLFFWAVVGFVWLYREGQGKSQPLSDPIEKWLGENTSKGLGVFGYFIPGLIILMGSLWTDIVLSIATGNYIGYPFEGTSTTKGLWILYFVGKRLSLFISIFS